MAADKPQRGSQGRARYLRRENRNHEKASNGHLAIALAAKAGSQVSRSTGGSLVFDGGNVLDLTAVTTPQPGDYIVAAALSISGTPGIVIAPPGVTARENDDAPDTVSIPANDSARVFARLKVTITP